MLSVVVVAVEGAAGGFTAAPTEGADVFFFFAFFLAITKPACCNERTCLDRSCYEIYISRNEVKNEADSHYVSSVMCRP